MTPSSPRLPDMANTTPAMTALTKAAANYRRKQTQRDLALAELQKAIRAADAEGGNTRNAIIDAAGVGRQTVYDALRPKSQAS
jgi:DNA invertase Pin-like site-specific DNA recombinase